MHDLDNASQPTEDADAAAMEHIHSLKAVSIWGLRAADSVFTPKLGEAHAEFAAFKVGLPRIYVMQHGGWERPCAWNRELVGYRYSLEHWIYDLFRGNPLNLVDDVSLADYVYLPHCATGIFMQMVAKEMLDADKRRAEEAGGKRRRGRRRHANGTHYLVYEGMLPEGPTRETDDTYLMARLLSFWTVSSEYKACDARESCRFLVVSCYGRHVWRRFAEFFGDKAVFITHAGLSDWPRRQDPQMFWPTTGEVAKRSDGCRAACDAHCVLSPPANLPTDMVMPWVVAFRWTERSARFASRDLLAFYSGTENSCSRRLLAEVLAPSFDETMEAITAPDGASMRARGLRRRVLAFPSAFRLRQEDWSEIAFRSLLCIVPDGDSPNTGRLIEVIMHGCVPVIVTDRLEPPLHEFLEWSKFAFFVREESIRDLPSMLAWLGSPQGLREVRAKHRLLHQAAHALDYNHNLVVSMMYFGLGDRARKLKSRAKARVQAAAAAA